MSWNRPDYLSDNKRVHKIKTQVESLGHGKVAGKLVRWLGESEKERERERGLPCHLVFCNLLVAVSVCPSPLSLLRGSLFYQFFQMPIPAGRKDRSSYIFVFSLGSKIVSQFFSMQM